MLGCVRSTEMYPQFLFISVCVKKYVCMLVYLAM